MGEGGQKKYVYRGMGSQLKFDYGGGGQPKFYYGGESHKFYYMGY